MADDGAEALRKLEAERFDAVLMDMQMPVMDGLAATRALRRREAVEGLPRMPVIMVTAHDQDLDKLMALRVGADDYVVKPFNPAEVAARAKASSFPRADDPSTHNVSMGMPAAGKASTASRPTASIPPSMSPGGSPRRAPATRGSAGPPAREVRR